MYSSILELLNASAVKASTQGVERSDDTWLWVALDCIEGCNARHCGHPSLVQARNFTKVIHVEGVRQVVLCDGVQGCLSNARVASCRDWDSIILLQDC